MIVRKLQHKVLMVMLALALLLPVALSPNVAWAKGNQNRERFYGVIQSKPNGLQGAWVIGGRSVTTNGSTEFDQVDGPLAVGGCAKVDIRNGRVHEIDSEPARNCR